MATSTAVEHPEIKHWPGILAAILVTGGIGAIIPVILYFL
jgi:hypothetical protein